MGQRCPRCSAPIEGDYKFCPACAFRLKPGAPEPLPPVSARSGWKARFLVALALAAVLACALLGLVLFQPSWFRGAPTTPAKESPETRLSDAPPLGVDDIPGEMVRLPEGEALRVAYPVTSTDADGQAVTQEWDLSVYIDFPMNAMKYEVTRSQYAEYLRDIEAHRERVPATLVRVDDVPREQVNLYLHVPPSWIVTDEFGEPLRWILDERSKNLPVTEVSYYDARAFAEWASERFHRTFVLPLAAEWARAARAAHLEDEKHWPWQWPWGTEPLTYACNNSEIWGEVRGRPYPVQYVYSEGRGGATGEGLYAMAGNVAEWAEDQDQYVLISDPTGKPSYLRCQARKGGVTTALAYGGSFKKAILDCTVESYGSLSARAREDDVGFRLFERLPEESGK